MPFARRRASKRKLKPSKSSTSSGGTSSTAHSRRDVHNRTISADASAPLLEPDSNTNTEYSPFKSVTAQSDVTTPLTALHSSNAHTLRFPRRFAPSFKSYSARPSSPDLESGPSRSFDAPPQPPLRHARTRIARTPMDPLPEDTIPDSPKRGPSPTATSSESHAPSPTSWLHIPKASGIPLIGAFRGSISSAASSGSSSLPTMQHYPSFTRNAKSVSSSSRSSQTFYSVASDGHTTGRNFGPQETTEQAPTLSSLPPLGSAARLKLSGVGERIPQVHLNPSDDFHASRQASMVYSNKSSVLSAPGVLRPDENTRPLSSTVGSGSSLSVYSDARSQLGAIGEDGRLNGSVGGSSGGRGRRS